MPTRDPTDIAAQDQEQEAQAFDSRIAAKKQVEDFKWLMKQAPGRRYAWRLLEKTGVFRTSFDDSSQRTAFNEGQRNIGLMVLSELNEHCPEQYLLMLKEHETNE